MLLDHAGRGAHLLGQCRHRGSGAVLSGQQSSGVGMAQAGHGMALCGVPVFKAAGIQQGPKCGLERVDRNASGQAHDRFVGVQFHTLLTPCEPVPPATGDALQCQHGPSIEDQLAGALSLASPLQLDVTLLPHHAPPCQLVHLVHSQPAVGHDDDGVQQQAPMLHHMALIAVGDGLHDPAASCGHQQRIFLRIEMPPPSHRQRLVDVGNGDLVSDPLLHGGIGHHLAQDGVLPVQRLRHWLLLALGSSVNEVIADRALSDLLDVAVRLEIGQQVAVDGLAVVAPFGIADHGLEIALRQHVKADAIEDASPALPLLQQEVPFHALDAGGRLVLLARALADGLAVETAVEIPDPRAWIAFEVHAWHEHHGRCLCWSPHTVLAGLRGAAPAASPPIFLRNDCAWAT